MHQRKNPYRELADRAARGDVGARVQLHNRMERHMVHLVVQSLRTESERSALEQHIFAVARRLGLSSTIEAMEAEDQDAFIRKVAHRVSDLVMENLPAARAPQDMMAETVCDRY